MVPPKSHHQAILLLSPWSLRLGRLVDDGDFVPCVKGRGGRGNVRARRVEQKPMYEFGVREFGVREEGGGGNVRTFCGPRSFSLNFLARLQRESSLSRLLAKSSHQKTRQPNNQRD